MNSQRVHQVFANYIDIFEKIIDYENYKWTIADKFGDLINPDAPDFAQNIKEAWKLSANLIDSSNRYCFSALVECAQKDNDAVRRLFKNLFTEDNGNLTVRQNKILKFIDDANRLIAELHSDNGVFMNDQRSAMAYLFLNDPDNHYLYKASEARSFASCIEFYEDWGSGADFRLEVYYRMCDLLVDEIKKSTELRDTNESRYYDKNGDKIEGMHPDREFHILAFDIIYGAPDFRYNFYKGIPFSSITAQTRKLHEERVKKAQDLFAELQRVQAEADLYKEAEMFFDKSIAVGMRVKHKVFGEGEVVGKEGGNIMVNFESKKLNKTLAVIPAFTGKLLIADIPELEEKVLKYQNVAKKAPMIQSSLNRAVKNFEPYKEYLD